MKKKYIAYAVVPLLAVAAFGLSDVASAHGWMGGMKNATPDEIAARHEEMFKEKAQILGMNVSEVKNKWAEGKTMQEIAEEKGITQDDLRAKMRELRLTEMKSALQSLVSKGVITQAQADQRLKFIQEKNQNMGIGKKNGWIKGEAKGRGF